MNLLNKTNYKNILISFCFIISCLITGCCSSVNHKMIPMGSRLEKMRLDTLKSYAKKKDIKPEERAYASYLLGFESSKNNDYKDAEKKFLESLKTCPDENISLYANYELARLYEKQIKGDSKDDFYLKALSRYKLISEKFVGYEKTGYALHRGAMLAARKGQYVQALTMYEKLIKTYTKFHDLPTVIVAYINCLTITGNTKKALEVVDKYDDDFKKDKKMKRRLDFARATGFKKAGKLKEAKEFYTKIIEEYPESNEATLSVQIIKRLSKTE